MANFGTYEGHRILNDSTSKMVDSASKGFQTLVAAMESKKKMDQRDSEFDRTQTEVERSALAGETLEGRRIDVQESTLAETIRSNKAGEEDVDEALGFKYDALDQEDHQFYDNLDHEGQQQAERLSHDWNKFVIDDENKDLDRASLNERFFSQLEQDDQHFYSTHGLDTKKFFENQRQYNLMDEDRSRNTTSNVALRGSQTALNVDQLADRDLDRKVKQSQLDEYNRKVEIDTKKDEHAAALSEFKSGHGTSRTSVLENIELSKPIDADGNIDTEKFGGLLDEVVNMTNFQSKASLRKELNEKYPNKNFSDEDLNQMLVDQKGDNKEVQNILMRKFNSMDENQVAEYLRTNPEQTDKLEDWIISNEGSFEEGMDLAAFLTGGNATGFKADDLGAVGKGWGAEEHAKSSSTAGGGDIMFKGYSGASPDEVRKQKQITGLLEKMDMGDTTWIDQVGDGWQIEVDENWINGGNDIYKVQWENGEPKINFNDEGWVFLKDLDTIDD